MKALIIGDVHAKVEDLEDCKKLRSYVLGVVSEHRPAKVIFLGDQFDNHAIKNVEVEKFWLEFFTELNAVGRPDWSTQVIVLVGNHDRPGSASSVAHSLQTFKHLVTVVDEPVVQDDILFLPYYHDPKALVQAAQAHSCAGVVICHAAFQGGHYDNGQPIQADAFYGKDVANPDDLPQHFIISGHIHTAANFGKTWYPGSPRWQTMSDANRSRAIWLVGFGKSAGFEKSFSTDDVLRRTWQLDFSAEDSCEKELALVKKGDKVLMNIRGTTAFCEVAKRDFQSRGYRVRAFPTDRGVAKVSEADGIPAAFDKHFVSYKPKYGTSPVVLRDMLRERLHV